jgi:phosphoenolpyruvate synthase/pyruvate phosphate dikinase
MKNEYLRKLRNKISIKERKELSKSLNIPYCKINNILYNRNKKDYYIIDYLIDYVDKKSMEFKAIEKNREEIIINI